MAGALEVVESEDVLEFSFVVHDGPAALFFSLLNHVDEELLNVFWLLVAQNGR